MFIKFLFSKYSFLEKLDHFIYHVTLNSALKPSSFKIILTAILLDVKSSYVITFAITIKVVKKFFKGKIVFVVGLIFYDRENYFL